MQTVSTRDLAGPQNDKLSNAMLEHVRKKSMHCNIHHSLPISVHIIENRIDGMNPIEIAAMKTNDYNSCVCFVK